MFSAVNFMQTQKRRRASRASVPAAPSGFLPEPDTRPADVIGRTSRPWPATEKTGVDCSEVLQQLADYLDEEARAQLCAAIEEHLSRCTDCQIEVDTLRKTIVLYQNDRRVEMPAHLTSRLESVMAREYQSPASAPGD